MGEIEKNAERENGLDSISAPEELELLRRRRIAKLVLIIISLPIPIATLYMSILGLREIGTSKVNIAVISFICLSSWACLCFLQFWRPDTLLHKIAKFILYIVGLVVLAGTFFDSSE